MSTLCQTINKVLDTLGWGGGVWCVHSRVEGTAGRKDNAQKMCIIPGGAKVGPSDIPEGLEKLSKEKMLRVRSKQ